MGGLGFCPGGSLSGGGGISVSVQGGICLGGSLSRGVSVQGGLCPVSLCPGGLCPGGLCQGDPSPPYGNERTVRILLEFIRVFM